MHTAHKQRVPLFSTFAISIVASFKLSAKLISFIVEAAVGASSCWLLRTLSHWAKMAVAESLSLLTASSFSARLLGVADSCASRLSNWRFTASKLRTKELPPEDSGNGFAQHGDLPVDAHQVAETLA